MIEEFAPAALIGFVLSGLVIFLGLAQVNIQNYTYNKSFITNEESSKS